MLKGRLLLSLNSGRPNFLIFADVLSINASLNRALNFCK
jgi:hypothetical protein